MASAGVPTLLLGVLCLFVGATSAARTCPGDYELIQNDCFKLVRSTKSVLDAERYCENEDATLASMSTLQMKEAVVDFVNRIAPGQYWTSGMDMGNGQFQWADTQQTINPSFKGRRFRSGTCVYMCSHTRRFWDRACDQRLGFICHKQPVLDFGSVEAF